MGHHAINVLECNLRYTLRLIERNSVAAYICNTVEQPCSMPGKIERRIQRKPLANARIAQKYASGQIVWQRNTFNARDECRVSRTEFNLGLLAFVNIEAVSAQVIRNLPDVRSIGIEQNLAVD